MKRLLVVSSLDVLGSPNSRTYHVVRHLSHHFEKTIAISRTNITRKSLWTKLTAFFRIKTIVLEEGNIRWVGMTLWGSIRHGLGLSLLGLTNPYVVPRRGIRRILRRVFNFLGIVFELGVLPSLVITFLKRVRGHIDVFVGEGPWEVCLGLLLKYFGRVRLLVYDDIDYSPGFQPINGFRKYLIAAIERFTIRHADVVISVGERLACLRRKQGAQTVHIVPNGVDRDRFLMANHIRSKKNQQSPTLVYMGYLGAWAGVDIIVTASARASTKIPGLRMILLGHGSPEELSYLRSKIRNLGVEDIVDLRGEVSYSELPNHLAEASIGLAMFLPLDLTRYAFPLKVVEYMAAGLPVLTTEDTEAADLVRRSGTGMAVPFDAIALADAIVEILQDKERYQRYSENAKTYSEAYDWEILLKDFYLIIKQHYNS